MRYPEHNNCLFWAVSQRIKYGGHLLIGRATGHLIPRFYWLKNNELWYFAPVNPKKGIPAFFHKFWFEGRPRRKI